MEEKEQIKQNVSITDVVSMYVDLKPAGRYLKALCPFHTEKTPSFYVTPEKESFSCYGCNKFGDIFTFIQEIENLTFPDAMNFLVDKFSIPIEKDKSRRHVKHVKKDDYAKINGIAIKFFRNNLLDCPEGKKATDYLKQRSITQQTIDQFQLGYAENKWDGLYKHLQKNSVDINKALELGLLIKNDSNRIYDRFRGRIIFPIFSESGLPIAFGGRTIFDEPNKYLNSPDTPLYKKSKHLYGFNLTKAFIRESKYSVLVEGYFDAVSLFQHGVKNVAASLGTALTDSQIYLLKRFSDDIYIFYDGDKAGVTAAVRGIEKMFEQNINPGIITLTGTDSNAKDPDDFVRAHGLKGFNRLRENSTNGFQFLVDNIASKYDLNIPERKSDAIHSITSFVEKFADPIIRNDYKKMAATYFKVDENMLQLRRPKQKPADVGPARELSINPAERIFLESLIARPSLIGEIKELITDDILSVLTSKNVVRSMLAHYNPQSGEIDDFKIYANELSQPEIILFREIYSKIDTIPKEKHLLDERVETAYLEFQQLLNQRQFHYIQQQIKIAEQQDNVERLQRLIIEKTKYIKLKYQQKVNIGGAVD